MADKRFSTPDGIAVYPALKHADTKFDELGQYKSDVSVPLAEAQDLMDELSSIHKAHVGKAPKKSENTMWYLETDEEGVETGNVVFKIRVKNRISKKTGKVWDRRPKLFDAALKPIDVNPSSGSKMVVSFEVYEWNAGGKKGVSLQPVGVQIIDLKEFSGPSGEAMGFAKRDDGFVVDDDGFDMYTQDTPSGDADEHEMAGEDENGDF